MTAVAWLVCLTFDFCLPGSSEGRTLFLWTWGAEPAPELSELGGDDGAGVGWCGEGAEARHAENKSLVMELLNQNLLQYYDTFDTLLPQ